MNKTDIKTNDEYLLSLIDETNDKYIDTDVIYHNNQKLPEPRDKSGVRDVKIDIIIK